ncbi:MAG TPA: hypothetical protein VJB11_00825 [archaeon]|nr:hypothetical protein [archaeon]
MGAINIVNMLKKFTALAVCTMLIAAFVYGGIVIAAVVDTKESAANPEKLNCASECMKNAIYPYIFYYTCQPYSENLTATTMAELKDIQIPEEMEGKLYQIKGPIANTDCPENCWCIGYDVMKVSGGRRKLGEYIMNESYKPLRNESSVFAGRNISIVLQSPVVPGTDELFYASDEEKITNPKKLPYGDHYCDKISDYQVKSNIDKEIIEADSIASITGTVQGISTTCKGLRYVCRDTHDAGCSEENGWFNSKVKCKDCKNGYESLNCRGEDSSFWGGYIGNVLRIVLTILGMWFYGLFWRQGRELFVQYKSVTSVIGCHHICKQDYTTSPCEAEPKCEKGGYVVVDNKTCGYECSPVDCGTRENIDIKIRVYDSENNTVFIDYADTDAKGNFDYTFSVPKKDGRYTAAVSVPEY